MFFLIVWLVVSGLIAMIFTVATFITKDFTRVGELGLFAPIVFVAWPAVLLFYVYIFVMFPKRGDVGGDAYVPHFFD